jgi:hypothetical protein
LARRLQPHELAALGSYYWEGWARDAQLAPEEAWRTWLICAGRGFGKTRAGAEWVRDVARRDGSARIALVGASLGEVRNVMVEGDSGVLAAAPGALAPVFEPSLRKLTWENGAIAWLIRRPSPRRCAAPSTAMPAGQAQMEFTVNEALLLADLALQCTVEGELAAPPASPLAGQAWLVSTSPSGGFSGHALAIAGYTAGGWRFIAARPGLRVYDTAAACFRHFTDSWQRCVRPASPTGGTTIDQEARTTITQILDKLVTAGLLATS